MNTRRETREFCLQFLYHFQLPVFQEHKKQLSSDEISLQQQLISFRESLGVTLTAHEEAWVKVMIKGILQQADTLELLLQSYLKNWKLHRLSRIEHTLLLMAAYELRYQPETDLKIVINEAIELAKKFSTKEAGQFINGVLDQLAKDSP